MQVRIVFSYGELEEQPERHDANCVSFPLPIVVCADVFPYQHGGLALSLFADYVLCCGFIVGKGSLFSHVCWLCLDGVMSCYLIVQPRLLSSLIGGYCENLCGVGCVLLHALELL